MPKGLGKGLGALIPEATPSEAKKEEAGGGIAELEIDKILPNKYQPRKEFNQEKLNDLIAFINSNYPIIPSVF